MPFIAPLSKATMVTFAKQILEGYWPKPATEFSEHERDDLGTARLEGTFGGRYRRTLELWGMHGDYGHMLNTKRPNEREILSYGDILIAFIEMGHGGSVFTYLAMGGTDICRSMAVTTITWAKRVEEWTE